MSYVLTFFQHCPEIDCSLVLGPRYDQESWPRNDSMVLSAGSASGPSSSAAVAGRGACHASHPISSLPVSMPSAGQQTADAVESSDEEEAMGGPGLEAHLRDLQLNLTDTRWIGKSSGAKLVLSALALKNGIAGTTPGAVDNTLLGTIDAARMRRPEYWKVSSVRYPLFYVSNSTRFLKIAHSGKRGTVRRFLVIIRLAQAYQRRSNKTATPIS
jgi:hypothetical protein